MQQELVLVVIDNIYMLVFATNGRDNMEMVVVMQRSWHRAEDVSCGCGTQIPQHEGCKKMSTPFTGIVFPLGMELSQVPKQTFYFVSM